MPPVIGTIIVLLAVGALLGGIVLSLIRDRKKGRGGCACGCEHCKYQCPSKVTKSEEKAQ